MPDSANPRLSERRDFREFVARLEDVVVWSGDETGFDYLSPAFETVYGRPVAAAMDDPSVVVEATHPEDRDRVAAAMEDRDGRIAAGESVQTEHRIVRPDGEVRWVDVRIFPLLDEAGEQRAVTGVSVDVTERRRAEDDLRRQNERLADLANVLSHDLRNPLTVAEGRLELARDECDSPHLDVVQRSHDRIRELIDDMMTFARTGERSLAPEAVSLATVVDRAWDGVETGRATLANDVTGTIRADPGRLQQLFENLFRNAVEHGSTGSQTPMESDDAAERSSAGSRTPRKSGDAVEHGDEAVAVTVGAFEGGFYVADDGPGIPPADRDRVFDRGYSTHPDGTGFGLPIVAEVASNHGWDVTVTESAAGGTRVEVTGVDAE